MANCPECNQPLPENSTQCPNCGFVLTDSEPGKTQIHVDQEIGEITGGQVIGVEVGQVSGNLVVGYTSAEVQILLEQISGSFQPRPFDGRSPYVGLQSFQEEDADRFFGRENLIAGLVERLRQAHFVLITGPSGSGKSSLVRAGVLPALKKGEISGSDRWLYTTLTPGRTPIDSLARATASLAGTLNAGDEIRQKGLQDPTILYRWVDVALGDRKDRQAVIFVDQFEEIFTQLPDEEEAIRQAFIRMLEYAATADGTRAIILLTMRSDFISNCAAYPGLNSLINQQFLQVGSMSAEELISAIARPALQVGLRVDPELVTQIIADMHDEPGSLPLMQFALNDLFEVQAKKGGVIALTKSDYLARGGLQKALRRYADQAFTKLSPQEQVLARSVFQGLVQPGLGTVDARRTALFSELVPAGSNPDDVDEVIRKLADARLVTTAELEGPSGDDRSVTLAHERLLDAWPWLHRLVSENRETIALQNEIQEDALRWDRNQRDESYLYSGGRLETARERLDDKKLVLTGLGGEFIEASLKHRTELMNAEQAARETEQRRELEAAQRVAEAEKLRAEEQARSVKRVRRWAIGLAGVAVLAVMLGVMAVLAQQSSQSNFREANSQRATAVFNESEAKRNADAAQEQTTIALSRQFAAQSLTSLLSGDLEKALILGAQAMQIVDSPQTQNALLTALEDNPRLRRILSGHTDTIMDLAYSPDGSLLASAGCLERDLSRENCLQGDIRLWDVSSGQMVAALRANQDTWISALAFSPDGKLIASGNRKGEAQLWDVASRQAVGVPLGGETDQVNQISFSPDGKSLILHTQDRQWLTWDIESRTAITQTFPGLSSNDLILAISPDLQMAVVQNDGQLPQIRDRSTSNQFTPLQGSDNFGGWTFSPNHHWVAALRDGSLRIWNTSSGEVQGAEIPANDTNRLIFTPDSQYLAGSSPSAVINVWDVTTGSRVHTPLTGHTAEISSLAFRPDGRTLASGSRDMTIRQWEWEALPSVGEQLANLNEEIFDLAHSPDGKLLAYGGCNSPKPEGDGCQEGKIVFLDAQTGLPAGPSLVGHTDLVNSLAFSPDGQLVASGSWDHNIIIWDVLTRQKLVGPLEGHENFVTGLAFTPDGQTLASSSRDKSIRRWDVSTGSPIGEPLLGQEDFITTVAYSPDGKLLASGSRDQAATLLLWDLSVDPPRSEPLKGHREQVHSVLFSPDGETLASSSADGQVILWDLPTRKIRLVLSGHKNRTTALDFSTDAQRLVSGSWDKTIILWDTHTGLEIGKPLVGHGDNINGVSFSQDGTTLITGSRDGLVLRWDLQPGNWVKRACSDVARNLSREDWAKLVGNEMEYFPACPEYPTPEP